MSTITISEDTARRSINALRQHATFLRRAAQARRNGGAANAEHRRHLRETAARYDRDANTLFEQVNGAR